MSARHERHECGTRENFAFDNDTNENIFLHSCITYKAIERLQKEEHFHSKNYFLEMPCSHVKMRLKDGTQKLDFVMVKVIPKSYTLDCSCNCSCTFPHSYV